MNLTCKISHKNGDREAVGERESATFLVRRELCAA